MNLATQLKELTDTKSLTLAERAQYCCSRAKEFEKIGEYEAAVEALDEFWPRAEKPAIPDTLDQQTKADLMLRIGSLTAWLGSTRQHSGSQETAKNLITQSIQIFEELGQSVRVAEAQGDLGLCYWREGALDEARITLESALNSLGQSDSDSRAILLIRAGIVEVDAGRLNKGFGFYSAAEPLVEESEDDSLKGSFHMSFALLFRRLAAAENQQVYIDRALIENAAASSYHERAGNYRYLARVENNLGFLFFRIGRYVDSHQHLNRARTLFSDLNDVGAVAQVDDTRARAFLAEGRLKEALRYARSAVKTLEKGDHCSLFVEALTTQGVILARLGNYTRSRVTLDRAIEVAETCGDLEGAGRAKLSIIEELTNQTSPIELATTFESAAELLQKSQDPSSAKRLIESARKVINALRASEREGQAPTKTTWEGFSLKQYVRDHEKKVIERALKDSGGAVTKAARLLGFKHHQSLISLINSRHRDLLNTRTAVRKRRRHLVSKPRKMKRLVTHTTERSTSQISILHVEDHKLVAELVNDLLSAENWQVELCMDGDSALRKLTGNDHYDLMLVDNDLPGLSGLELIQRARKMTHRRRMPILMLSGNDYETEAWRVGVDAFLKKPEQINELPTTINRLLKEGSKYS